MSNTNNILASLMPNFRAYGVILGIIFFLYIFLAGWGTDPSKYKNINVANMNCEGILNDVDRLGLWGYLTNGIADAPQHYEIHQQPTPEPTNYNAYNEGQTHTVVNTEPYYRPQQQTNSYYYTKPPPQEPLVQSRAEKRAIRKAEKATRKFWNGHHR